ncbi:two-component system response regulator [gut metagenome]|uniref:Two-component system response regulator n=1 Tax=gut metagenome TaxID=749906 RepID=J9H2Y9_9ZZZZ
MDDDEYSIDNLCLALRKYDRFTVEGTARNGIMGKRLIEKVHPDLLFLDVELPDMKGMELVDLLRDSLTWDVQVVFYTAYDKYMIDAIRSAAFDFLLKPIDRAELDSIIERFLQRRLQSVALGSLSSPHSMMPGERTFMIATPTSDIRILRSIDIGFFRYRSERKLWEVMLNNGTSLYLKKNTTAQDIKSYDSSFVQIHQSYIINLNYLTMVQEGVCRLFPPFDQVMELQVSKKFKKELQERFLQL